MDDEYDIGSRHMIWINPSCVDTPAEVVSFDKDGQPIMRTLDEDKITLEPHEYIFPTEEERAALNATLRTIRDVYEE